MMASINPQLEQNLVNYCKTQDSQLFEARIYNPLCYLASSICTRHKVTKRQLNDGIVQDMVSHAATMLPISFDETKGKAKCAAYILMNDYLLGVKRHNSRQKRDNTKTVYIEDESFEGLVIVEIDEFKMMKQTLQDKRQVFENISNKTNRTIALNILDCIENPEHYVCSYNSYVKSIAEKCSVGIGKVYDTIELMHSLMEAHEC